MGKRKLEKGLPSGLREQLEAWHSAYCPDDNAESLRHRSVLVPVAPDGSGGGGPSWGSCSICNDCGAILLGDEECSHCSSIGAAAREEERSMAGRLLGGKWRLIERVGGGSFGTFWRGEHHILGMKVGIKILRRHLTATPAGLKLFHAEAMRVSLLNHPGIVKLFDYGEDAGVPYLVMEYLSGKPLHEFLGGRLQLEDYIEIVCHATKALISAHRGAFTEGDPLAHLDLKPEHIFIERIEGSWHVKVIDFGLAEITAGPGSDSAAAGEAPRPRVAAGTPPYMGPERFQGVVDPRSDLYSLGVILYQCVAGRMPFECKGPEEYRAAHERAVPVPPSRHAGRSASRSLRRLDHLILWALSKELRDRPATAEVFLESLEEWKRRRVAEIDSRRWPSRARRWVAGVLACAMSVLFLLWASPHGWVDFDPEIPVCVTLSRIPSRLASGSVRGVGYVDATIFLELQTDGGNLRIPLGAVEPDGRFRVPWPGESLLNKALGADRASHGSSYRAALVSSRLGRSVRSPPFTLELDYEPPRVLAIEDAGGANLKTQVTRDGLRVFLPPGAATGGRRLVLRASEHLDLQSSLIRGNAPSAKADEEDAISLELRGGQESIECLLADRAGNKAEATLHLHPVKRVSFNEPSKGVLPTSDREVRLSYAVEGDLGHLEVLVDGRKELESKKTREEFRVQLSEAPSQSRKVVLRAWSVLSDPSAPPDAEQTLTVQKLERRIEVVATREAKGIPRLRVLDASTREGVAGARIEATATQGSRKLPDVPCEGGSPVLPAELRGMLQIVFTARDPFGNVSDPLLLDVLNPDPPAISSFEIVGGLGTRHRPLHAVDCACRPLDIEGKKLPLTLEAAVDYTHLDDLRAEIDCIDTDGTRYRLFTGRGQRFEIPQADLLRFLDPGENILELSLFDSRDPQTPPDLRASRRVIVHVARLDLTAYPPSGEARLDSLGRVSLRIKAAGARIEGVLVNDRPVKPLDGSEGEYAHDLPVSHHGYTTVFIEARADGRTHRIEREYHRLPAEGIEYVFPVRLGTEVPALRVRFHRTSAEGQAFRGFWFSGVELGEALDRQFRGKPRSSSAGEGVTRAEAGRMLRQLEKELEDRGWIAAQDLHALERRTPRVKFPTGTELRLIGDPGPRLEWLEPEAGDLESGSWSTVYGEVSTEGIIKKWNADAKHASHRAAFRIVIEHGAPGSKLDPCKAEPR